MRYDWRAYAELNNADFYDLFGPTKVGRKGYVFGVGHHSNVDLRRPAPSRLRHRRPYCRQSRSAAAVSEHPGGRVANGGHRSEAVVHPRRGIDREGRRREGDAGDRRCWPSTGWQGRRFRARTRRSIAASSCRSRIRPSVVRSAGGASSRPASEPFANFFFGGFGNNWIDRGDEKRYRTHYSFPGVGLNEIGGRNFVKSLVEWNMPPKVFRRIGTPGFYLTWARPAVFAGVLATNLDAPGIRRELANVGAQMDFRFTALSNLDLTLSIGGAAAFEDGVGPRRELMVSLKILRVGMTLNIVAALLPAIVFLVLLFLMDSFKLVSYRAVASAVAAGAASAIAAAVLHEWLLRSTALSLTTFTHYVAPVTEESLKAALCRRTVASPASRVSGRCRGHRLCHRCRVRPGREHLPSRLRPGHAPGGLARPRTRPGDSARRDDRHFCHTGQERVRSACRSLAGGDRPAGDGDGTRGAHRCTTTSRCRR